MPTLPRPELDALILTAQEVTDLAYAGQVADGYTALLAGLHPARQA